ncbi:MAG: 2-C-methyl-D-erythritol 2,4-cyclodiphosphate synthase [Wolbachia endosymbiont of Menacanthus eurysternus]|nr:MAG: 2-C-methyl-D-erythritol 2,4-cyclodiphosphate synthase [Wolbachia endosymbiont of Menacanthus eurysternus]
MYANESKQHKIAALIAAAGIGSRFNNNAFPKQYIKLAGKPVLFYTIKKLLINQYIDCIRVIINKNHENFYKSVLNTLWITKKNIDNKLLNPVYGGKSRQNSIKLGLESLQKINPDFVIIHDGCRPFVSNALINNLINKIGVNFQYTGVIPIIEIEDTILLLNDNNSIKSIISRKKLKAIQTPQIFNFKELLLCHQSNKEFTDDSSLMIENKKCISTIRGEKSNFKLTTKEDISMTKILFEEPKYRVGTGYDIHKFIKIQNNVENFIRICGVKIKHNMAIEAHSDGDVAIHAIVDAILGALGYGDIGEHFPSNLSKWKNQDSFYFLNFANNKAKKEGYRVSNLDVTIICEKPKISPYKTKMEESISKTLEIDSKFVNIKATTVKKIGPIGRNEGIAAYASILLHRYQIPDFC